MSKNVEDGHPHHSVPMEAFSAAGQSVMDGNGGDISSCAHGILVIVHNKCRGISFRISFLQKQIVLYNLIKSTK